MEFVFSCGVKAVVDYRVLFAEGRQVIEEAIKTLLDTHVCEGTKNELPALPAPASSPCLPERG